VKFEISKRARRQIEKMQTWWVANRQDAPTLLLDELAEAERELRAKPKMGTLYSAHKSGDVLRIPLTRTNNYLYYRYRADRDELIVLAVWGAPREHGPKL
jgi:plasmid stabilization system protein ParE